MSEKNQKAVQEREIKPNFKRPFEFDFSGRTFRGSVKVVTGKDKKGEDIVKIVESKTRFIPAVFVAMLMSEENPDLLKKFESKLVPLSGGKSQPSGK